MVARPRFSTAGRPCAARGLGTARSRRSGLAREDPGRRRGDREAGRGKSMAFTTVLREEELWDGEKRGVEVEGRKLLLVNIDGADVRYRRSLPAPVLAPQSVGPWRDRSSPAACTGGATTLVPALVSTRRRGAASPIRSGSWTVRSAWNSMAREQRAPDRRLPSGRSCRRGRWPMRSSARSAGEARVRVTDRGSYLRVLVPGTLPVTAGHRGGVGQPQHFDCRVISSW